MTRDRELCVLDDVTCLRTTDGALQVRVPVERASRVGKPPTTEFVTVWIPHQFVHADSEVWRTGDVGTLVIPEWLAAATTT